jgi:glyoxylase-like metal-dependent hydrolase (beta-lactamase superfamily II)
MHRSVLLSALSLAAGCLHPAAPPTDVEPPLALRSFTSGAEGFDTHSWWVDTGAEVVVFDAQFTPALAGQLLDQIRAETDSPVKYVVVTHPNPDKFNGATVFQAAGAELVASEATAAALPGVHAYKEAYFVGAGMFAPGAYPALPEVDLTFSGALTLPTEQGVVRLVELRHGGVTTTQTVAVVGEDLIVGDLVGGRVHAWLEGGIVDGGPRPDLAAWQAALGELPALGSRVRPGRGETLPVEVAVAEQQEYLRTMDRLVDDALGDLADPRATLGGPEAGQVYAALTADAEAAFPGYGLSYLVTYGVYGLAMSKLP